MSPARNDTEMTARRLYRAGGVAAFILVVYSLATMVQIGVLGGQPSSAAEAFELLRTNKVVGLLRLDLPTVLALPLYYLVFLALSTALWRVDGAMAVVSGLFVFAGVTLALATPMGLSMLPLSDRYAASTTDAARNQLLAAGEAIRASDMWHGTGAIAGGLLTEGGAVLISMVMIRGGGFGRRTGWLGVVVHGLDFMHIAILPFFTTAGTALLIIAGPLYPVWLFLAGRALLRMARTGIGDPWASASTAQAGG